MTQTANYTGNTILADGFNTPGALSAGTLSVNGATITVGAGAPTASATQGSLYLNTTGNSTSTRLYVNNGTTNWVAVTTAS